MKYKWIALYMGGERAVAGDCLVARSLESALVIADTRLL
jgi:hypothetical protein